MSVFCDWRRIVGLLMVLVVPIVANAEVRVHGLFAGKAMFSLDGERFLLSDGETGPGGLRLIRATSQSALVEHQGQRRELFLERGRFGGLDESRAQPELRIQPDAQGGYFVRGLINGHSVRFVVDTGATVVTLSEAEAERLRLPMSSAGSEIAVETASGQVIGRKVVLNDLRIGVLHEQRVEAVVLPGDRPSVALLGMSLLSRLNMRNDGSALILQAR